MIVGIAATALFFIFRRPIIQMFINDEEVIQYGIQMLIAYMIYGQALTDCITVLLSIVFIPYCLNKFVLKNSQNELFIVIKTADFTFTIKSAVFYLLYQILHILKRRPLHLLPKVIPDLREVLTDKLLFLYKALTRNINISHVRCNRAVHKRRIRIVYREHIRRVGLYEDEIRLFSGLDGTGDVTES